MDNLTVVVPCFNGEAYLNRLLDCLPASLSVVIIDDHSEVPLRLERDNTTVIRPERKGYFTGAVNEGIRQCKTDVLVLNQDVTLTGTAWLDLIADNRDRYALIGERIKGDHPAFPHGYVHGVFQFMRRDAIEAAGLMDEQHYPLWGASALWQWQIARKGFEALPLPEIPGLYHEARKPGQRYGDSIVQLLAQEPEHKALYIRTPPAISVVIPCYNYGQYLTDTIHSLIGGKTVLGHMPGQTFQSFEVLIVDDGSTDNTPAIAKQLANSWQGIKYIRRQNGGTAAANNTGIQAAIGKYITIMAADDMREPWSLSDLYEAALEHPDKFVYDELTTFAWGQRGKRIPLLPYDCRTLPRRNMVHAGILFPKAAWQQAGGYPESMRHGREDWAFNVALALNGWHGHKIERSGYLYRREGHNRSLANSAWREHFIVQLAQLFPQAYQRGNEMACCGGGSGQQNAPRQAARGFQVSQIPAEGMVLVKYLGGNVGGETWGGPGTVPSNRYYVFGRNEKDRIKYVDARDVTWFLNLRENGKSIFQRYEAPVPKPPVAPPPVIVVPEAVMTVDPSTLTVNEIKALTLTLDQWLTVFELESTNKNRKAAIDYMMLQIETLKNAA